MVEALIVLDFVLKLDSWAHIFVDWIQCEWTLAEICLRISQSRTVVLILGLRIVYKRQLFEPFLLKIVLLIWIQRLDNIEIPGGLVLVGMMLVMLIFDLQDFLRVVDLRFIKLFRIIRFLLFDKTRRLTNIFLRL